MPVLRFAMEATVLRCAAPLANEDLRRNDASTRQPSALRLTTHRSNRFTRRSRSVASRLSATAIPGLVSIKRVRLSETPMSISLPVEPDATRDSNSAAAAPNPPSCIESAMRSTLA